MPEIYSIVYTPDHVERHPADHYARVSRTEAQLRVGQGIEGDRKGGHPRRQLNIMSYETLAGLHSEGFTVEPGRMGEQIIVRGLIVDGLPAESHLQIGATAVVEIAAARTGCERFEHIQGKSPDDAAGRMGMMARVVSGGAIRVGDAVKVLEGV